MELRYRMTCWSVSPKNFRAPLHTPPEGGRGNSSFSASTVYARATEYSRAHVRAPARGRQVASIRQNHSE